LPSFAFFKKTVLAAEALHQRELAEIEIKKDANSQAKRDVVKRRWDSREESIGVTLVGPKVPGAKFAMHGQTGFLETLREETLIMGKSLSIAATDRSVRTKPDPKTPREGLAKS